jgi:hypothetical protein
LWFPTGGSIPLNGEVTNWLRLRGRRNRAGPVGVSAA